MIEKVHAVAAGVPAELVERAHAAGITPLVLLRLAVQHGDTLVQILQVILDALPQKGAQP